MLNHRILLLLLALAGGLAACSTRPAEPARTVIDDMAFVITEQGQFETIGEVTDVAAPDTAPGKVGEHGEIRLVRAGLDIPARKGVSFGFRYRVEAKRYGPASGAQMNVIHPPMVGVDGKLHTTQTVPIDLFFQNDVAEDNILYILSEDFEVLPGTWTLQILFGGKVAASRTFLLR